MLKEYIIINCTDPQSRSLTAMGFSTISEVRAGLSDPEIAGKIAKSLLRSKWLKEFQLSEKLRLEEGLADALAGWNQKPPPERHKRRSKRQLAL